MDRPTKAKLIDSAIALRIRATTARPRAADKREKLKARLNTLRIRLGGTLFSQLPGFFIHRWCRERRKTENAALTLAYLGLLS